MSLIFLLYIRKKFLLLCKCWFLTNIFFFSSLIFSGGVNEEQNRYFLSLDESYNIQKFCIHFSSLFISHFSLNHESPWYFDLTCTFHALQSHLPQPKAQWESSSLFLAIIILSKMMPVSTATTRSPSKANTSKSREYMEVSGGLGFTWKLLAWFLLTNHLRNLTCVHICWLGDLLY